jgi:hypothetical protein
MRAIAKCAAIFSLGESNSFSLMTQQQGELLCVGRECVRGPRGYALRLGVNDPIHHALLSSKDL